MTLKTLKKLFFEISDLCMEIDDENLSINLEPLYRTVEEAEDTSDVIDAARELMIFVNEVPWSDEELDGLLTDIENLYNKMLEDEE